MPGQWNLDRVDGPRLDGYFSPPECLCGKGVHVYVLDTGVRFSHEDFAPSTVRTESGWNFVGDCTAGGGTAEESGWTHVAATAVGATSGVAKCAVLVPVRILDENGKGDGGAMLSALDWVADHDINGRKIVSMSVGGPRSAVIDAAVRSWCTRASSSWPPRETRGRTRERDVTRRGGGGDNRGEHRVRRLRDSFGPSSTMSSTMSTASCGGPDAMSDFSNRGAAVDVYAPGAGVRSADDGRPGLQAKLGDVHGDPPRGWLRRALPGKVSRRDARGRGEGDQVERDEDAGRRRRRKTPGVLNPAGMLSTPLGGDTQEVNTRDVASYYLRSEHHFLVGQYNWSVANFSRLARVLACAKIDQTTLPGRITAIPGDLDRVISERPRRDQPPGVWRRSDLRRAHVMCAANRPYLRTGGYGVPRAWVRGRQVDQLSRSVFSEIEE